MDWENVLIWRMKNIPKCSNKEWQNIILNYIYCLFFHFYQNVDTETIKRLVEKGINIFVTDKKGFTPLSLAHMYDYIKKVSLELAKIKWTTESYGSQPKRTKTQIMIFLMLVGQ